MTREDDIRFVAKVMRKQPGLPRYIIVKAAHLAGRTAAFRAMVRLNASRPFPRNIRPWGKGSDAFFFNVTAPQCAAAGLDTGDECTVEISPDPTSHP